MKGLYIARGGDTDDLLNDLNVETFRELTRWHTTLDSFGLSHFRLKTIGPQTFVHFKHLSTLCLQNLGLDKIENGTFNCLPNLVVLSLSENFLEFLEPGVFGKLSNLRELWLYGNPLSVECGFEPFFSRRNF